MTSSTFVIHLILSHFLEIFIHKVIFASTGVWRPLLTHNLEVKGDNVGKGT